MPLKDSPLFVVTVAGKPYEICKQVLVAKRLAKAHDRVAVERVESIGSKSF